MSPGKQTKKYMYALYICRPDFHCRHNMSQLIRYLQPWWVTVCGAVPTLTRHWLNILYLYDLLYSCYRTLHLLKAKVLSPPIDVINNAQRKVRLIILFTLEVDSQN